MAEGLLRHLGQGRFEAASAGTRKTRVDPRAVQVMAEIGIDISGQASKRLDGFLEREFDLVVTVCDRAREACPAFPGARAMAHWSFEDPAEAAGTEDEILESFRRVRDRIREKLSAELLER